MCRLGCRKKLYNRDCECRINCLFDHILHCLHYSYWDNATGGRSPKLSSSYTYQLVCTFYDVKARSRLTFVPLMIPVVAIKNFLPLVCFDIHLNAAISVNVHPPKKNTTVVVDPSALSLPSTATPAPPSAFCRMSTVAPGILASTSSNPLHPAIGCAWGRADLPVR